MTFKESVMELLEDIPDYKIPDVLEFLESVADIKTHDQNIESRASFIHSHLEHTNKNRVCVRNYGEKLCLCPESQHDGNQTK